MPRFWSETNRKATATFLAFAAVTTYAYMQTADFGAYANAIEWILGIFVTGHAATDILTRTKPVAFAPAPAAVAAPVVAAPTAPLIK